MADELGVGRNASERLLSRTLRQTGTRSRHELLLAIIRGVPADQEARKPGSGGARRAKCDDSDDHENALPLVAGVALHEPRVALRGSP